MTRVSLTTTRVPGARRSARSATDSMLVGTAVARDDHQACRVAIVRGVLGDKLRRKIVVERVDAHGFGRGAALTVTWVR